MVTSSRFIMSVPGGGVPEEKMNEPGDTGGEGAMSVAVAAAAAAAAAATARESAADRGSTSPPVRDAPRSVP